MTSPSMLAPRDQGTSAFGGILHGLCEETGALCVALVDGEGETVDYAGRRDPYHAKVVAAELRLVLAVADAAQTQLFDAVHELWVRAERATYMLTPLEEGYALVLELSRKRFSVSQRAVSQALRDLSIEAGLEMPKRIAGRGLWRRIEVRVSEARPTWRPSALWLEGRWQGLAVMGRYLPGDLAENELAYHVRLDSGAEFALVREPSGSWFAEDLG